MIRSMTGYGAAKGMAAGLSVTVELKSVNNRYLDVSVKLPRGLLSAEDALKAAVGRHTTRGKVDMFVTVDAAESDDMEVRVNEPLLCGYIDALRSAGEKFGLVDDMTLMGVCRLPEVLSVARREVDAEELAAGLVEIAERALTEYDAMREREGARLREVLADRTVDEARILTECAIFADRVAVDEETVRLRSHLDQLTALVNGESPVGRKMDFLIQELNRESNTIGSKGNDLEQARTVVELKAELEKIREQTQNIE